VSNNTVCVLITKDQKDQKEKWQLSKEEKKYQDEYNKLFTKNQETESVVVYKEKEFENAKW
jgi:hypothetical protein